MTLLDDLLRRSAATHARLCPRQVLGVRMGLLAGCLLDLDLPQTDKRLLTIAETDGCLLDGISAATGCQVGRRTLRIEDYGKVAATFVHIHQEQAVRIWPSQACRELAQHYAGGAQSHWEAQLIGYQRLPAELLLCWSPVSLVTPLAALIGQAGSRARCARCHEEILNQREVVQPGAVLCRACAGQAYYTRLTADEPRPPEPGAAACPELVALWEGYGHASRQGQD